MVRISNSKGIFEKGYLLNWSKEHFIVEESPQNSLRRASKRRVYKIKDYGGEPVKGIWYQEDLQQISDNQYRIKKVLRRRTSPNGTKKLYVKWEGWPENFNSWIKDTDEYNVAK